MLRWAPTVIAGRAVGGGTNSGLLLAPTPCTAPAPHPSPPLPHTPAHPQGPAKEKLPRNWKKAKEKDGTVYYVNTVTQRRCHEVPPPLPAGWREALHKDSGRVYYYHKATRQSTYDFPTAGDHGDDDDDMEEDEPPPAPEGLLGRTMSLFKRGKKEDKDDLGRSSTIKRSSTMAKKGKQGKQAHAKDVKAHEITKYRGDFKV